MDDTEVDRTYVAYVVCDVSAEPRARAILMERLASASHIEFTELEIANIEDTDHVELTSTITSHKRRELALETVIGRLSKESGCCAAGGSTRNPSESHGLGPGEVTSIQSVLWPWPTLEFAAQYALAATEGIGPLFVR